VPHRPSPATDADVDDVHNPLAGMPLPLAGPHTIGEVGHSVEHGVDMRNDILSIHDNRTPLRSAERHVQDPPVLRDVNLLSGKHGIDTLAQPRFSHQLHKQLLRFVGHTVLRITEEESHRLDRHPLAALRIFREERSEMYFADLL